MYYSLYAGSAFFQIVVCHQFVFLKGSWRIKCCTLITKRCRRLRNYVILFPNYFEQPFLNKLNGIFFPKYFEQA